MHLVGLYLHITVSCAWIVQSTLKEARNVTQFSEILAVCKVSR